ncbi:unnamed protein product [Schistosoma margrebowiei]|uniref:Uncharacterized protein n=1 Tax=Schistosoma margrebowiei TaxID=48269 RepID=A0A183MIK5_9TREM|nr:unnamed protein product [Schistosoma margrebowiei]
MGVIIKPILLRIIKSYQVSLTTSYPFNTSSQILILNSNDIYRNLAFEECLYHESEKHLKYSKDKPSWFTKILLWRSNSCIVIGRFQNAWKEANIPLLHSNGWKLARRHSGGGAVYHDLGNLNISFIQPRCYMDRQKCMEFLQSVLQPLLIPSNCSIHIGNRYDLWISENQTNTNTLQNMSKISGSSSKFGANMAYHHCTLLFDANLNNLSEVLKPTFVSSFLFLLSIHETLDIGFMLLGTRQQGVPVILREMMLPDKFDSVSLSFTCGVESHLTMNTTTKKHVPNKSEGECGLEPSLFRWRSRGIERIPRSCQEKVQAEWDEKMVVGGSRQETLDLGFVLLGTRQQGVPVILRETVLPDGFDPVSPSFTIRDNDLITSNPVVTNILEGQEDQFIHSMKNFQQILTLSQTWSWIYGNSPSFQLALENYESNLSYLTNQFGSIIINCSRGGIFQSIEFDHSYNYNVNPLLKDFLSEITIYLHGVECRTNSWDFILDQFVFKKLIQLNGENMSNEQLLIIKALKIISSLF